MSASDPSPTPRDFCSVAGQLTLLAPQVLEELSAEATRRQTTPAQLALEKGLLDATQIDIIEMLSRPTDAVPGYEILGVLGQGGMGVVYRARQLSLNRIVALKTVLVSRMGERSALDRLEQEAQVLARLAHPHIVTIHDFGRHQGRLYFAMELVVGEDAQTLVHRHGPLEPWAVWGIVRQAAAGLAYAAEQGIVHRDIKPANLLLVEAPLGVALPPGLPMVKIADFGLAQLAAATDQPNRLTMAGETVGSPNYMSPEQLLGEPVDRGTDIFSLGASAFHLLAGKPPLAGKNLAQIVARRTSGPPEAVSEANPRVSHESAELVAAMMAHDRHARPADYRELTRRIDALELLSPGSLPTVEFASPSVAPSVGQTATTRQIATQPTIRPTGTPGWLGRKWWTRKWFGAGAIALAAILVLIGDALRRPIRIDRTLAPSGRIEELFNGQNINQWKPVSGSWSPAKDDEGALVLEGRGVVRRSILIPGEAGQPRPLEHYRLMLVVESHQASAVEVRFDLAGHGRDEQYFFVRIDRDGSTLIEQTGLEDSPPVVVAAPSHPADGESRHAVEIERQSLGWLTWIDGQPLGAVPLAHEHPAAEFRLVAEGGPAWFSDLTVEELELPIDRQQDAGQPVASPR